jgi:hypothetical protein
MTRSRGKSGSGPIQGRLSQAVEGPGPSDGAGLRDRAKAAGAALGSEAREVVTGVQEAARAAVAGAAHVAHRPPSQPVLDDSAAVAPGVADGAFTLVDGPPAQASEGARGVAGDCCCPPPRRRGRGSGSLRDRRASRCVDPQGAPMTVYKPLRMVLGVLTV